VLEIVGIANDFSDLLTGSKTKEKDRNGTDWSDHLHKSRQIGRNSYYWCNI